MTPASADNGASVGAISVTSAAVQVANWINGSSTADVVNPRFLGGPNQRMVANSIENLLLVQLQAPRAAALTLVLMVAISALMLLQLRRRGMQDLPLP